jgi:hypothetical protein
MSAGRLSKRASKTTIFGAFFSGKGEGEGNLLEHNWVGFQTGGSLANA